MFLTVAICTYQRVEPLRAALESLSAGAPIAEPWELVLIDNGCQDAIQALARSFAGRLPIRYEAEPVLGTSHARNHAVRAAKAPIILFTDDDVTFDPQWLPRMAAAVAAHPECAFWGGRVEPVFPAGGGAVPRWWDPRRFPMLDDMIVQYRPGDTPRYFDPQHDHPFYTANLALRTAAVTAAGGFDTTVGHRGGVRMGMEDSLMVKAIAGAGHRGWYAADAIVHHPVPPDRLTRRYAREFVSRQGWLSVELVRRDSATARTPRWLYRLAAEGAAKGVGRYLRGAVTLNPAERVAGALQFRYNAARLRTALRGGSARGA